MNPSDRRFSLQQAVLVSRYTTPFAVVLVAAAVVLSQPRSPLREISVGLLFFGILFNMAAMRWLKAHSGAHPLVVKARMAVNFTANVVIVYLLGGYWSSIWLLLALTPVAMAVYTTKTETMVASLAVSITLLLIHASRGFSGPLDWGQQVCQAIFIILLSLMVNDLARVA